MRVQQRLHGDPAETILLLEDSSDMVWAGGREIEGLSQLGQKGIDGFVLHSVLAVGWNGSLDKQVKSRRGPVELIGLADQQYHLRTPKKAGKPLNERESQIWMEAGNRLGDAPKEGPKWIRVCDRGADIYDFMHECTEHNQGYVVRSAQNRRLDNSQFLLFEAVGQAPSMGSFNLDLRSRPGRKARTACLQVSSLEVTLASVPGKGRRGYGLPPVTCTVVRVWEELPGDDKPLEWILLTDRTCPDFETALETALMYSTRWVIEEFHKCLKTGMGAERLQLHTAARLFAAVAIMSVTALRLVDLRERSRLIGEAEANHCGLGKIQLKVLERWREKPLLSVNDVAMALGRLGGHMNRKADGMPGFLTLWKGYRKLTAMVDGYLLAKPKTYG